MWHIQVNGLISNGTCYPHKHYMVNLASRLKEIKKLVEDGEYIVIQLSFERFSTAKFRNEQVFSVAFAKEMVLYVENKRKNAVLCVVTMWGGVFKKWYI